MAVAANINQSIRSVGSCLQGEEAAKLFVSGRSLIHMIVLINSFADNSLVNSHQLNINFGIISAN